MIVKPSPVAIRRLLQSQPRQVKLDLGCGESPQPGFIHIDIRPLPGVDIVWDLQRTPWPLPDECGDFAIAGRLIQCLDPARLGLIRFMDELWRVLRPEAQIMISAPYGGSPLYWADPACCLGVTDSTFPAFDPLHPAGTYAMYRPKPWKLLTCNFQLDGLIELAMCKRRIDKSYGVRS